MKIKDLIQREEEMLADLRHRAINNGDNGAARVYLEHLRAVSKNIDEWKKNKDRLEAEQAAAAGPSQD